MCSGCCVCHSSRRALSPPSSMREARLRAVRQNTAAHDLLSKRSLRAVVEGDRSVPCCVPYRKMLEKEFSTVFEFAKNILTDVDHSKRGEAGIARINQNKEPYLKGSALIELWESEMPLFGN